MGLKVDGLCFSYSKERILRDLSFEIPASCFTAIMGENGSGKTTLLKTINRVLKPRVGTVWIDGMSVKKMTGRKIARHIGYVSQRQQTARCTVFEAVLLGRKVCGDGKSTQTDLDRTEEILRWLHIDHLAWYPLSSFSEPNRAILPRSAVLYSLLTDIT